MTARLLLAAAAALPLAACVPQGEFPSLAMRPAELDRSMEPPQRAPVEVPPDAELRGRVEALRRRAAEGDRAFDAAYGATEAAVSVAGARESDSWIEAQPALSRLEATRVETMTALAELDQLAMARVDQPTGEADFAAINAAIAEVERIALAQQSRMDRLRARLGG